MKPATTKLPIPSLVVMLVLLPSLAAQTTAPSTPAASPAAAPALGVRDLLVHGTGDYLWTVDVVPTQVEDGTIVVSTVRFRTTGDPQWRPSARFESRAVSLGSRGNELLVVLADGEWLIVAQDSARSGAALPDGAAVLALAGAGDELWAVGAAAAGKQLGASPSPATRSTRTRGLSTRPATTAATGRAFPPHDVGLFHLVRGSWREIDALPPEVRRSDALSLLVTDQRLLLAVAGEDRAVRLYTRLPGADAHWESGDQALGVLPEGARLKLMDYAGRPLLWLAPPGLAGSILIGQTPDGSTNDQPTGWGRPITLQPPPALDKAFDQSGLASALGRLRLIATDGKGRIAEQIYDPSGAPSGPPTEALATPIQTNQTVGPAIELLVLTILFLSMLGAMRQRPNLAEAVRNINRLHLAPLGRRFVGGLIDALPVLICGYIGLSGVTSDPAASPGSASAVSPTWDSAEVQWIVAGIGIYLLHVTLLEILIARSIGKLITGTRVATLTGSVPTVSSVLIRNLLRPLDLLLLVLLYLSPLRQRVGDMAAGTLVVMGPPRKSEDAAPAESANPENSDSADSSDSDETPPPRE